MLRTMRLRSRKLKSFLGHWWVDLWLKIKIIWLLIWIGLDFFSTIWTILKNLNMSSIHNETKIIWSSSTSWNTDKFLQFVLHVTDVTLLCVARGLRQSIVLIFIIWVGLVLFDIRELLLHVIIRFLLGLVLPAGLIAHKSKQCKSNSAKHSSSLHT